MRSSHLVDENGRRRLSEGWYRLWSSAARSASGPGSASGRTAGTATSHQVPCPETKLVDVLDLEKRGQTYISAMLGSFIRADMSGMPPPPPPPPPPPKELAISRSLGLLMRFCMRSGLLMRF